MFSRNNPVFWVLLFIALATFWLMRNKQWTGNQSWGTNICSDGRGYYAWLPAVFIYQDMNYGFADSIEHLSHEGGCLQDYRKSVNGRALNKYYPGAALGMLPFFAAAHLYCILTGHYEASGFSPPYFIMIGIAGWCFLLIGLGFVYLTLKELNFSHSTIAATILIIMLGGNLLSYAIDFPSYSHIYSFAVISAATWLLLRFWSTFNTSLLWPLAFLCGWMIVIRPINLTWFILLIVFLLNKQKLTLLMSTIRLQVFRSFLALGAMAIMPLLLLVLYYFSTGTFVLYSYKDESFDFLHPHFFPFLFGQDSGILLYTPALFFSMVLALLCQPHNRLLLFTILAVLLVSVYVHSSWWCWWYGHTFGSRTMLDFMILFAILVAHSLTRFSGGKKVATIVLYSLSACITMIVYHQAHHGYLGGFPKTDYFLAIAAFFGL